MCTRVPQLKDVITTLPDDPVPFLTTLFKHIVPGSDTIFRHVWSFGGLLERGEFCLEKAFLIGAIYISKVLGNDRFPCVEWPAEMPKGALADAEAS